MGTLINMFVTALSAIFLPVQEETPTVALMFPHQVMAAELPTTEGELSFCCFHEISVPGKFQGAVYTKGSYCRCSLSSIS